MPTEILIPLLATLAGTVASVAGAALRLLRKGYPERVIEVQSARPDGRPLTHEMADKVEEDDVVDADSATSVLPRYRRGSSLPPPEWFVNEERERSVSAIADRLIMIGQRLKEAGAMNLDNVEVRPNDPSLFALRFERLPRGELKLHLEIEWSQEPLATSTAYVG